MSKVIYDNSDNGFSILESRDNLIVDIDSSTEEVYKKIFEKYSGTRSMSNGKINWNFSKNNADAIKTLNKITQMTLEDHFTPAPVNVWSATAGASVVQSSSAQESIQDRMLKMSLSAPPKAAFQKIEIHRTGNITFVEYSEKAIVLFAPQDWSRSQNTDFPKDKGFFTNKELLDMHNIAGKFYTEPDEITRSYGYCIAKSNKECMELFNSFAKTNISELLTVKPAEKKDWKTFPTGIPKPGLPTMTPVVIPGIGPEAIKPNTPMDMFNEIVKSLGQEYNYVQMKKFEKDTYICILGSSDAVQEEMDKYATYETLGEIVLGRNKIVMLQSIC